MILATAPPAGPYSREQLDVVNRVGLDEFDRMKDRCLPTVIGTPAPTKPDIEAELAFFRMAELIRLVILNYPYAAGRDGQTQRSDDVSQAVQGFERAYLCHPGWEQRHYLNTAMTLLETRIRQIRDVERRQLTETEDLTLQQALARLQALRSLLRAPTITCAGPKQCPPPIAPAPTAPEQTRGYRAQYMDLLSLRIEAWGGDATLATIDGEGVRTQGSVSEVFQFSIAPGVRFLAGRRRRHVFGLGFRWTWNFFTVGGERNHVNQVVTRFEYGIRANPKWLSLHLAFEPGLQGYPLASGFGRFQVGGSGALCTWNEAFCVRLGGYYAIAPSDAAYMDGWFAGPSLDLLRVADNVLRKNEK